MTATVDIGVACAASQFPKWWVPVVSELFRMIRDETQNEIAIGNLYAISSALPDHNKNNIISPKKRLVLTDSNRQSVSKKFLEGNSDWLFMVDDDTVFPKGAIIQLVRSGRELIAGTYFLPSPPHNPIAYLKQGDGFYYPLTDFPQGAMIQVDSVGMGCTLIHRSVFEKIQAEHIVFQRPDGTLYPVHQSRVENLRAFHGNTLDITVKNGYMHIPVTPMADDDNRPWPFFAMEYGRTEDHFFCELAANVGIRPWLDTNIRCAHLKPQETTFQNYLEARARGDTGEEK